MRIAKAARRFCPVVHSKYTITWMMLLAMLTLPTLVTTASPENLADEWFEKLDTNSDGAIDRSEYKVGFAKLLTTLLANNPEGGAVLSHPGKQQIPSPNDTAPGSGDIPNHPLFLLLPMEFSLQGFWKAFTSSVAMIVATEIGDKTFFIAAVLSMKHDRSAVFAGAITALIIMTILSTGMGLVLPKIIPRQYTHFLGGVLFLYFGIKLISESRAMEDGKASEELEEVEEELLKQSNKKRADEEEGISTPRSKTSNNNNNQQQHLSLHHQSSNVYQKRWYQVALQSLSLTFLAEWGDRSQIATIALAAAKNPVGVTVGGCLGYAMCTGLAVVGGRMLAARISEKTVHQWGGAVFLLFGFHSIFWEE
jgi:putative Ca2+/H+ antiporter (TMEM165/GDT1 family)